MMELGFFYCSRRPNIRLLVEMTCINIELNIAKPIYPEQNNTAVDGSLARLCDIHGLCI